VLLVWPEDMKIAIISAKGVRLNQRIGIGVGIGIGIGIEYKFNVCANLSSSVRSHLGDALQYALKYENWRMRVRRGGNRNIVA